MRLRQVFFPMLLVCAALVPERAGAVVLTTNPNPSSEGQTVSLSANAGHPTGSVTFKDGSTTLGSDSVSGGFASLRIALSLGTHHLTATYIPGFGGTAEVSNTVVHVVKLAQTLSLTSQGGDPSVYGQNTLLIARSIPATPGATPTGTVTFYDGVTVLGEAALVNSTASIRTPLLPAGVRALSAYYPGNSAYGDSRATLSKTVLTAAANGFKPALSIDFPKITAPGFPPIALPVLGAFVADFNGDGKADILALQRDAGQFSVLLGNGAGGFSGPVVTALHFGYVPAALEVSDPNFGGDIPNAPGSVALGDFDGDGNTDFILVEVYPSNLLFDVNEYHVWLGNGDGSFRSGNYLKSSKDTGNNRNAVVADFDGDGIADFASLESTAHTITIWTGDGAGHFTESNSISVPVISGHQQLWLEKGDFNRDGIADLIFIDEARVYLLLGKGDGTFGPLTEIYVVDVGELDNVIAGDFDGDGKLDLAVEYSRLPRIQVLLGKGDGTFRTGPSTPMVQYGNRMTVADVNGDGIQDLVTANWSRLQVLLGNGDGSFQAPIQIAPHLPANIDVADFDGDGRVDLLTANHDGGVTILPGLPQYSVPTLTASTNTAAFQQPVTLTATLAPFGPFSTGSIKFLAGGNNLSASALDANGQATITTTNLSPGTYSLTARYLGDSLNGVSDSTPVTLTVTPLTTLTASINPSTWGQAVTLTTQVTPTQAGSVTFYDGATQLGTANLTGGGKATFTTSTLTVASHSLKAVYSGGGPIPGSTSPVLTQVVQAVATTVILTSSQNPASFGQPLVFTVTVTPSSAAGTVKLQSSQGTVWASAAVTSGSATITIADPCKLTGVSCQTESINVAFQAVFSDPSCQCFAGSTSSNFTQTLNPISQTISFDPLPDRQFTGDLFTLSATATSGKSVSFSSSNGNCTIWGTAVTLVSTGSCTITATQAGGYPYSAAPSVSRSFTVSPGSQTIQISPVFQHTFGDSPIGIYAQGTSTLFVTLTASGMCSVANSTATIFTITILGAGSCTLTAKQPGDANYLAAPDVTQTFIIAKADQTITFPTIPNHTYLDSPFAVNPTASSGLAVTVVASGQCSYLSGQVTITGSGSCTLTASQPGNNNYTPASAQQTFAITKAVQTITFPPIANHAFGDATFTVSAAASSGLAISFSATGMCGITGVAVTLTGAGDCTITATQAGDSTYLSTSLARSFSIAKATPTVNWARPAYILFGVLLGPAQLNAVASVPGVWTYSPPAGAGLNVGDGQILSATFAPTDSANYAAVVATTTINVKPKAGPPQLIMTRVLTRNTGNDIVVAITLKNAGGDASNVQLTAVSIGSVTGAPLPQTLGSISAGGQVVATVTLPGSAGVAGAAVVLTVSGSYTGGTFGGGSRATLP